MIFRNLKSPSSDSFIDLISSIPDGCTEPLTIYLDQPYDTFDGFVFEYIDFFNSYKGEVTLVATGNLTNSTALFFLCSNTKKVISPVSSLELSKTDFAIFSTAAYDKESNKIKMTLTKYFHAFQKSIYSQLLNMEEMETYHSGEIVFIAPDRMKEVVVQAEKLFHIPKQTDNLPQI